MPLWFIFGIRSMTITVLSISLWLGDPPKLGAELELFMRVVDDIRAEDGGCSNHKKTVIQAKPQETTLEGCWYM